MDSLKEKLRFAKSLIETKGFCNAVSRNTCDVCFLKSSTLDRSSGCCVVDRANRAAKEFVKKYEIINMIKDMMSE
jgi:hypothetical protein